MTNRHLKQIRTSVIYKVKISTYGQYRETWFLLVCLPSNIVDMGEVKRCMQSMFPYCEVLKVWPNC